MTFREALSHDRPAVMPLYQQLHPALAGPRPTRSTERATLTPTARPRTSPDPDASDDARHPVRHRCSHTLGRSRSGRRVSNPRPSAWQAPTCRAFTAATGVSVRLSEVRSGPELLGSGHGLGTRFAASGLVRRGGEALANAWLFAESRRPYYEVLVMCRASRGCPRRIRPLIVTVTALNAETWMRYSPWLPTRAAR